MSTIRLDVMATIRQRRPGVWEVRGYTGKDIDGKSTQVSQTVYGTKKDAKLAAAELTVKPARNAGGRKLRQLLDEWIDIKLRVGPISRFAIRRAGPSKWARIRSATCRWRPSAYPTSIAGWPVFAKLG